MSTQVRVDGFRELDEALKLLTRSASKGTARRALINAGRPLVAIAKAKAPVDRGTLRASIDVSQKLDAGQKRLARRGMSSSEVQVYVGPSYSIGAGGRHGHFLEFGTRHHGPQPFMRPAWAQDQRALLERLKDELWAEISKSIARAERKAARQAAKAAAGA